MKICLPFCTCFINLISHFVCLETSNINYNIHLFLFRKKNETVVILYKKRRIITAIVRTVIELIVMKTPD